MSQTVRELIDHHALHYPDKVFIAAAENRLEFTYAQIKECAEKVESYLDRNNIMHGDTVAFMLDNGCWTAILMLSIMYCGRVALPLNVVAGPDQLEYIIDHSDLKLLFCSPTYKESFSEILSNLPATLKIAHCDEDSGPTELTASITVESTAHNSETGKCPARDDVALLIYTSGTTGKPKGVLLSHENIITGGQNTVLAHGLTENDKTLCILPLYHINAEMVSIMAPLVSNGSVVISRKPSISRFWRWIIDYRCTWFSAVPTIIAYLIEHQRKEPLNQLQIQQIQSSLRFARSASAPLSPSVHQSFESMFDVPIIETMGISECAAQILSNPVERKNCKIGSPGIAWGNEIRIVDKNKQTLDCNSSGEIAARGKNIMQGYYKNPEETAKVLDNEGWFYTGDLGHMDSDGFVYVTGRLKELIIKGGENIAPREIDDVLYRHPGVLEAAAFAVSDELYGQEVEAAIAVRPGSQCEEQELLQHCENLLGKIKTPKRIHILAELPKGPSGKIQRLKLPELVLK